MEVYIVIGKDGFGSECVYKVFAKENDAEKYCKNLRAHIEKHVVE